MNTNHHILARTRALERRRLTPAWALMMSVFLMAGCGADTILEVEPWPLRDALEDGCLVEPCALEPSPIIALAAGGIGLAGHTCALRQDGQVVCWGSNGFGQLGDGLADNRATPARVRSLDQVWQISSGTSRMCALRADSVLCWGEEPLGRLEQSVERVLRTPSTLQGLGSVAQLVLGDAHACALDLEGRVLCLGFNDVGQLGDGPRELADEHRQRPGQVTDLRDVVALTAGDDHTCALSADGLVSCWGRASDGQIGDGALSSVRRSPSTALSLRGAVEVAAGADHTCARQGSGLVFCWGKNSDGQLGDGTTLTRAAPVQVVGLQDAVELAVSGDRTCARRLGGQVVCWGKNSDGQLGDGSTSGRVRPVQVVGLQDAVELAAGPTHTCARRANGQVVCWGKNSNGQLGDGTAQRRMMPVQVLGL